MGLDDEWRTPVIFNNWALFYKKRIKEMGFLLKSATNLLSLITSGMQGIFLSFNIFSKEV